MSISIHELLAVARESEGVKAVQGDDILCEKRFCTGYPIYGGVFGVGAKGMVRGKRSVSPLFSDKGSVS